MKYLIIVLEFLTHPILILLPAILLWRDWRYHNRRLNEHRIITRGVLIAFIVFGTLSAIFSWCDKTDADKHIAELKKQVSQLDNKITEYQIKEDKAKLTYIPVGYLQPANEPDPPYPTSMQKFNKQVPKAAVSIFLGNNLCFTENLKHLVVIRLDGHDILTLNKGSEGLMVSMAKIYREEDGAELVNIENNKWSSNPNLYFKPLVHDPHQLELIDKSNKTILLVRFINENSIKVEGYFYYPGSVPIVISDKEIIHGQQKMGNNSIAAHGICIDYEGDATFY